MKKVLFAILMFCSFSAFSANWCFENDLGQRFYTEMTNPVRLPGGRYKTSVPLDPVYIVNGEFSSFGERFPIVGSALLYNGVWSFTITSNFVSVQHGFGKLNQVWKFDSNFANGRMFEEISASDHTIHTIDCSEFR